MQSNTLIKITRLKRGTSNHVSEEKEVMYKGGCRCGRGGKVESGGRGVALVPSEVGLAKQVGRGREVVGYKLW